MQGVLLGLMVRYVQLHIRLRSLSTLYGTCSSSIIAYYAHQVDEPRPGLVRGHVPGTKLVMMVMVMMGFDDAGYDGDCGLMMVLVTYTSF